MKLKVSKLLICLFFSFVTFAQTIKGKVIRVADGDTITLLDSTNSQIKVRLYGIDYPEKG